MPTLAGWLTGEGESQEVIEQALAAMEKMLEHNGGSPNRQILPGAGLVAFADPAYTQPETSEPPILDWTPDRRTLVYRRPLSGLHPLYYLENWPTPGNLLFASEIKALFALGAPRRLHLPALDALWRYGFIPAPWTAFQDIHIVPAGSILRWQHGKTLANPFTDYRLNEPEANILDRLDTLLDEASVEILPSHDQLIYFSDGGVYSALASLFAARHHPTPPGIATLSYGKSSRVNALVETLSLPVLEIKGLDLPEFWLATIEGLEAPVASSREMAAHQLLHTTAIETGARVAISGLGGRVLLESGGDYAESTENSDDPLKRYRDLLRPTKALEIPWSEQAAQQLREGEAWEETQHARRLARLAARFPDSQVRNTYLDLHLRLPDQIVYPLQKLAAQEQIALRSPYLNAHVMDALTRLPATLADGTPRKQLAAQLVRRFLPLKMEAGPTLKAPTTSLLQMEKHELLQQLLSEQALHETGLFDSAKVAALLTKSQRKTASRELILVFTTQLLCKMFGVTL